MTMPLNHFQTIQLAHLPPDSHSVHVALYHSVTNAAFLHEQLLAGNTDFEYAFIDASVIVTRVHALAAAFRAIKDSIEKRLKTKNVHSEIVLSLSPNGNIAESFRRFGITPTTTSLLIIKVSNASITASSVSSHLSASVHGVSIPFEDAEIAKLTDFAKVKKVHKLNSVPSLSSSYGGKRTIRAIVGVDEERVKRELETLTLGSMALRGFA